MSDASSTPDCLDPGPEDRPEERGGPGDTWGSVPPPVSESLACLRTIHTASQIQIPINPTFTAKYDRNPNENT